MSRMNWERASARDRGRNGERSPVQRSEPYREIRPFTKGRGRSAVDDVFARVREKQRSRAKGNASS